MTYTDALEIVFDLAEQNALPASEAIENSELEEELEKQRTALSLVGGELGRLKRIQASLGLPRRGER